MLGLPASGKSTLERAFRARLRKQGWDSETLDNLDKADHGIPPVMRRDDGARALFRTESFRNENPELMQTVDRIFAECPAEKAHLLSVLSKWHVCQRMSDRVSVVLLGEGFWHRAVQQLARDPSFREMTLEELARRCPEGASVIYIEADPKTALERRKTRILNRAGPEKGAEIIEKRLPSLEQLTRHHKLLDQACNLLKDLGTPVVRVTAYDPVENMVDKVIDGFSLEEQGGILV